MINQYFKIAWRNLQKNKLFTAINIISLSIGLSASFIIGLIVYHDMTFDKFHKDSNRIYRVTSDFKSPQGTFHNSGVAVPLTRSVYESVTGLSQTASFYRASVNKVAIANQPKTFKDIKATIFTDQNYFQLFEYNWLSGNLVSALKEPNKVVLTQEKAESYFPGLSPEQVIGLNLTYNDSILVEVAGVVESFKNRSDLFFDEFISKSSATSFGVKDRVDNKEWNNTNSASQLFVKVDNDIALENIQAQLDQIAKEHVDPLTAKYSQTNRYHLQPLSDIHFNPIYGIYDYSQPQANMKTLIGLGIIAIFLLLLGCVNFINLNTVQGLKRSKEVGVRKTLGGSKKQIKKQFLTETFLLTLGAALLSILISFWLLGAFEAFIPKTVTISLLLNPMIIAGMLFLIVIVALVSGFYPALVLSKFNVTKALKDQVSITESKVPLRKYLTVFQFVIAQIFVMGTILVAKQIDFMMTEDMGIKTEAVAYINIPFNEKSLVKKKRILDKFNKLPQIEKSSIGGRPPASFGYNTTVVEYTNGDNKINTGIQLIFGDNTYIDVYDIELLAGRKPLNDTIKEFVVNEKYMKILGFDKPDQLVGQYITSDEEQIQIVGVMKNFNQRSLKFGIEPMAFMGDWYRNIGYSQFNILHFSLPINNKEIWQETIANIESVWQETYPDIDFRLTFMDASVQRFYDEERKISQLLKWATGLSILISCLGLFGLVIYTTERRTKEFLVLVAIAFLIAAPFAWWGINSWLQDFTYKTGVSWEVFAISGIGMIIVAVVIMSFKTIAAGMRNPVKSLRTE